MARRILCNFTPVAYNARKHHQIILKRTDSPELPFGLAVSRGSTGCPSGSSPLRSRSRVCGSSRPMEPPIPSPPNAQGCSNSGLAQWQGLSWLQEYAPIDIMTFGPPRTLVEEGAARKGMASAFSDLIGSGRRPSSRPAGKRSVGLHNCAGCANLQPRPCGSDVSRAWFRGLHSRVQL